MFLENENIINDDLDILSQIFNPVEEQTLDFEEGENRVVSILFLDVKGFTAMSETMTSEEVRITMDKILLAFSNSILKFGGYIDKYEGDLLMALFGSKITSETDTERAIDAGLKILSDLKHINNILNINLAIRIGINTGQVTTGKVGMKREGDFTVYGDAVNIASRMESNAPLNSIMIPKETKDIVHDYFLFEDLGEIDIKGKENPMRVFKVISKNPKKIERWERNRSLIQNSSYVGRTKELVEIIEMYNNSIKEIGTANNEYKPFIVGLKGSAGIGKSRLIKEVIEAVDNTLSSILSGYTKSYAQPAYCIWTTMFKNYFNIEDDDSKETIKKILDKSYEELQSITKNQKELTEAKNVIGYMFGVKYEDVRLVNIDPQTLQTLINIAIRHTIEAIAVKVNSDTNKPLVIYFDDVQWIDEPSQNLFKNILSTINIDEKREDRINKNIVFLLTYRSNYEPFKEIYNDSRFTEFELKPLSIDDSKELIDSMIGKNNFSATFFEEIMNNGNGNPFYIEELVHYLIENEKISRNDDVWSVSNNVKTQIPLTLNNLILSRIDNLNDYMKVILQRASVIGCHFFKPILNQVTNKIDNNDLDSGNFNNLVSDNWITKDNDDEKYLFKHILTADVCYKTILQYNKKILHRIIAETSEEVFKENDEYCLFISNHYVKSNPKQGSKNYGKMLEYLEKAGSYSKKNYENDNALKLFDELLAYEVNDQKKVEIDLEKADVLLLTGKWEKAKEILNNCLDEAKQIENNQLVAKSYRLLGTIHWRLGETKGATECHDKSLEFYKVVGNESGISESYGNIGNMFYCEGEYDKAMDCYDKKLTICKKLDDKKGIAGAVGNMGVVCWVKEDYDKAMEYFEVDLEMCEEIGDKLGYNRTIGNMGLIHSEKNDYSNAMLCYEKKLSVCEEIGDRQGIAQVLSSIGYAYEGLGENDRAMEYYEKSLILDEELGNKEGISITVGNMGNMYYENRNYEKAIDCYNRSIVLGRELNIKYYLCSFLYFKANAMYMLKDYNKSYLVNEEAIELSIEVDRKESIFKTKVLKEKLDFMITDDIEKKKIHISNIKKLLIDEEDNDTIAQVNYEIVLLLKVINEDFSEYKEKAIDIFQKLYETIPNVDYKKRIDELKELDI